MIALIYKHTFKHSFELLTNSTQIYCQRFCLGLGFGIYVHIATHLEFKDTNTRDPYSQRMIFKINDTGGC